MLIPMTAETPGVLVVAKNAAPENKPRRCNSLQTT